MAAAQHCVRLTGSDICPFHPDQKVVLECEDCPGTLVCSVCTATLHKRHVFRELNEAVEEKTDKTIAFIQKVKQETLPELVQCLKMTTGQLKDNKHDYQDTITQMKQHGDILKMEVDLNTAKKVSKLELVQKENNDMLEQHCKVIEKLQTELLKAIKECEQTLKTGSKTLIYDTEHKFTSSLLTNIPAMPALTTSTFTPCRNIKSLIDQAFGDIMEFRTTQERTNDALVKPASDVAEVRFDRFLPQAKTLLEQQLSYSIFSNCICPTTNNMAWAGEYDDNKLHLVDNEGVEHKTLELDVEFVDISINPTSQELYCSCIKDNSVRRINTATGETTLKFNTKNKPWVIACVDDDRMVVFTEDDVDVRRMYMYKMTGKRRNHYVYNGRNIPDISVCPNTKNIALLGRRDGVTVLKTSFQEMYTYRGQGLDQMKQAKHETFVCCTAVFVDKYLLVGDHDNKVIHVLTSLSGECLHLIKSDSMSHVEALGVQQDGVLWVVCDEPNKLLCIKCFE